MANKDPEVVYLVYDSDCPFCSAYVDYVRVKESVGTLQLVSARDGGPIVEDVIKRHFDLDDGMVLVMGNQYYHGHDCINRLALLSTPSNIFNRLNALVFRNPKVSRVLYPVLRFGRNIVLRLLGRTKIATSR
jgi:predicted DCC family thiol-disulfide oxidoreductase YuxK